MLSAGHGRRLRPLTSFVPKPLLPVCGEAALARTIDQLAEIGCDAVAVNLFHRGEMIRESLERTHRGVPLTFSIEEQLLGTLGALSPLEEFFREAEAIVVVNGDSLCRWPLRGLVRRHLKSGAVATLLVSRRADPEAFGGGVGVVDRKRIVSLRPGWTEDEESTRRVFMGAHVISPKLLDRVPEGPCNFVPDLYEPLLAEGAHIAALESSRKWHDLGTPERYRRAVLEWAPSSGWHAATAEIAPESKIKGSVLEDGVVVGPDSLVEESVVLAQTRIGEGCRVEGAVIGPGVHLPPHTRVQARMVTPVRSDAMASEEASVVGGLVYEPI